MHKIYGINFINSLSEPEKDKELHSITQGKDF